LEQVQLLLAAIPRLVQLPQQVAAILIGGIILQLQLRVMAVLAGEVQILMLMGVEPGVLVDLG
jgi:hypothetical protein